MIIKKFQGGGFATFTPIINMPPAQQSSSSKAEESSDKEESSSILDDKILKDLYDKGGLTNDVNRLVAELIKLEQSSTNPFIKGQNRTQALQLIAQVNEIKQNKNYWEDAIARAKEAGGLSEVAVSDGMVFTKTSDNKIKAISLNEYSNNRNKINLLSVQELLYERQYNPNLVGRNEIFTVSDNAIGMNKIMTRIQDIVSKLGSETTKNTDFYSKTDVENYLNNNKIEKPTAAQQESLSFLQKLISTPGDYFEVESKQKTERNHLGAALKYIWNTLGSPAQQKLRAVSIMNGEKDPTKFILDMLVSQSDYESETKITPKSLPGEKEKGTKNEVVSLTPQELLYNDRMYKPGMTYEINNSSGIILRTVATGIGPMLNLSKSGEIINAGPVSNVVNNTDYKLILDAQHAYIGDTKIDPLLFSELAYTGEDIAKVYIPVKEDGTPDLAQMSSFQAAYEIFNNKKDTLSTEDLKKLFRQAGFPEIQIIEKTNEDGSISKIIGENSEVKPFFAMPIITNSASDLADLPWMVELYGEEKKRGEAQLEQSFGVVGGTPSKPKIIDTQPSSMWSWEDPYKGILFIQFRPEASAYLSSMNKHLKGNSASDVDLFRNLNYTSGTVGPNGISGSSDVLK